MLKVLSTLLLFVVYLIITFDVLSSNDNIKK